MESSARESYLVNDVMTATPQKLQLMLIEAAIRSAQRARKHWQAGEDDRAVEALDRAQEAVGEMLAGLNREAAPKLVNRVASVYLYLFRTLMEASHQRDEKKLADALRVLQLERETWRQVCQQLGSRKTSDERSVAPPPVEAPKAPHADMSPGSDALGHSTASGLSLEA